MSRRSLLTSGTSSLIPRAPRAVGVPIHSHRLLLRNLADDVVMALELQPSFRDYAVALAGAHRALTAGVVRDAMARSEEEVGEDVMAFLEEARDDMVTLAMLLDDDPRPVA